jgi:hypothetical protein
MRAAGTQFTCFTSTYAALLLQHGHDFLRIACQLQVCLKGRGIPPLVARHAAGHEHRHTAARTCQFAPQIKASYTSSLRPQPAYAARAAGTQFTCFTSTYAALLLQHGHDFLRIACQLQVCLKGRGIPPLVARHAAGHEHRHTAARTCQFARSLRPHTLVA